jgi:hypothetical protein
MVTQAEVQFTQFAREMATIYRRDVTQGIKLAKYKKGANAMLKSDPIAGHTLLGLAACLEHDLVAMHWHHKKAIEIHECCFSLMYYFTSLQKSCLWSEAVRYGLMALDHDNDNIQLVEAIIAVAPMTGRVALLKRLFAQWQNLNDRVPHPNCSDYETIGGLLAKHGVTESDLKVVLAAIGEALSETDIVLREFQYEIVTDHPVAPFLHYRFVIPDHFVASYYEDLLGEKLNGAQCHPRIFDAFSFSVENTTIYELYDCMDRELEESADTIRVPDPEKMKLIEELVQGVENRSW